MPNDIAISDQQVPGALARLAPEFQFLYPGKPEAFRSWSRSAALAVIESPGLRAALTTDTGKRTLIRALQRAASTGLSLNPQEGKAALVAFADKITYMPMKNGLIELALNTGKVEVIEAETVYENDGLLIKKTAHGDEYEFSPARKNRGAVDGYYAAVLTTDGRSHVKYMDIDQVKGHAEKYGKGLDKADSAWRKSFDGMAQKTVLKSLLRALNIAPSVERALDEDDAAQIPESGAPGDVTPKGVDAEDVASQLESGAAVVEAVLGSGAPAPATAAKSAPARKPASVPTDQDIF